MFKHRQPVFTGAATALITPFKVATSDLVVDYDTLTRLVEWQLSQGIDALVPCGTTGQAATLRHHEQAAVIRHVVQSVAGRVPVIAGTGSNSTDEAIELTKTAREAGADAALLISPYYNRPTQEGIYQHYLAVARAVPEFRLIVYNIPGRTGSKIEAVTIERLSDIDEIVGLKEATGSLDEALSVYQLTGGHLPIYSGDDALTLPIAAIGGKGVISVTSNVVPKQFAEMTRAALISDFAQARVYNAQLFKLMRALFTESNPIPVQTAMALMGFGESHVRLPLTPIGRESYRILRNVLQELRLINTSAALTSAA